MRWLIPVALLAACAASRKDSDQARAEPAPQAPVEEPAGDLLEEAEAERSLFAQQAAVLYRRHYDIAKRFRDQGRLEVALIHVDQALRYRADSEDAIRLRLEIQRMLGRRDGSAAVVFDDELEAEQVKRQQWTVTARRLLDEARKARDVEDWESARRAYERVLSIAKLARREPWNSRPITKLGEQAERELRALR